MSDTEIRTLERQAPAVGTVERERLERTWLRSGLGWHGEPLPEGLRATDERGLYVWRQDDLAMPFVYVPAGPFLCGPEKKSVELPAYYIARYPTTWREFHVFTRATKRRLPLAPRWGRKSRHPVVNVSWDDSVAFARWAGLDLPTGHEWEKAARGTDGRTYPWGEAQPTPKHAVFGLDWDTGSTRAVCDPQGRPARPLGASPYDAHDMVGNVWEWCAKERERSAGPFPSRGVAARHSLALTTSLDTTNPGLQETEQRSTGASAPSSEEREPGARPFSTTAPSGEAVVSRTPTSPTPTTFTPPAMPGAPSASAPSSEEREPSGIPFTSGGRVGSRPTASLIPPASTNPIMRGSTSASVPSSEERDAPSDDPFMPSREGAPSFGPEVRGGETSLSGSSAPGSSTRNPRSSPSTSSTASVQSSEEREPGDGPLGPEGAPVGSLGGSSSSTSPETSIWTDPLPTSRKTPASAPSSEERERSVGPFGSEEGDSGDATSGPHPARIAPPDPTTTSASAPPSEGYGVYPSSLFPKGRCFASATMTLDALDHALGFGGPMAGQRMVLRA